MFYAVTERMHMKKDVGWKSFFEDNHRYADVINGVGCNGKQFVKDTDLQEVETAVKGKTRDLLRRTAFGVNFALIGVESQETIDYRFPLRNLHYEVNQYEKQAARIKKEVQDNSIGLTSGEYLYGFKKDSKLYPVITFMIYSGKEPWDGPMSLHDIIDFTDIPEELRSKVADFPVNMIDIRRLEDTSVFQTDVKYVFDFIRYSENKEKLYELVSMEPYYQAMDEDAFDIVSMYTNSKELVGIKEYEGKDGKKDVCQAIKDLMADSRQEGREEGIKEGIKEGIAEGIEQNKLENARNLLGFLSDEIIAEKIGLPLEKVKELHVQA